MTTAASTISLMTDGVKKGLNLDGIAEALLGLAAAEPTLTLEMTWDGTDPDATIRNFRAADAGGDSRLAPTPGPGRLFRPLLARIATKAVEENGGQWDAYGGHIWFDRPSADGPVRLEVEFSNTPASQRIQFIRVPLSAAPAHGVAAPAATTSPV